MDISICLITKNECKKLERCLMAIRKVFGELVEIVVVDTGSTDDTCQMVKKYTDKLFFFEWINDFAAAKNFAAASASNDIVAIFDSDEYLSIDDCIGNYSEKEVARDGVVLLKTVLQIIESHKGEVGRIYRINDVLQGTEITQYMDWTNRIFDRNKFCFKGCIHEQLVRGNVFEGPSGDETIYNTYMSPLAVLHDGYVGTKEEIAAKAERNASLLLKELKKRPDDVYVLYQTGKAYYMMGDYLKASEYFGIALEHEVEPAYEYVQDLVETYGYSLIETGNAATAVLLESVEAEFGHSADFRFMMGLAYMNNAQFDKAIESFDKATAVDKAKMKGVDSYLAWYNIGVIFECLGSMDKAVKYYKKCGSYDKALIRINEIG